MVKNRGEESVVDQLEVGDGDVSKLKGYDGPTTDQDKGYLIGEARGNCREEKDQSSTRE